MAQGREIAIFMFLIILFFLEKRFPHTLFQFEPHKRENDDGFKDKIFCQSRLRRLFPSFRPRLQCDQIWRNFTTLAKFYESLSNGRGYIQCLANF